ncbi:type VI secretion system Vgr family protein [Sphingomonas parva]|uniref:type VI secretion system Vgr family protein n=1 Tax=Sphingomonas parva TaxID=2555898 RepID=UPI001CDBED1C|nr:type VI secretion system tip protein TssI/VgrG [Sphingomonas parva]
MDDYALLSFEGREGISEPYEYRLELITTADEDVSGWIGKLAEFDVSPESGTERVFAGRIYGVRRVYGGEMTRVVVQIRPAYFALSYGRATHFIQDKSSLDIFDAMTADVSGLVKRVGVTPTPAVRGYAVRYDETEIDFLARLLAQDGIMYFFVYERQAGPFRHKMIVTNQSADYVDLACGAVEFLPNSASGAIDALGRRCEATPRSHQHLSFNVNKLDEPFVRSGTAGESWGGVYSHSYDRIGFEAVADGDVEPRSTAQEQEHAQAADQIEGSSSEPCLMAGGRLEITGGSAVAPRRVVLTSVTHSAYDPWMIEGSGTARYRNSFVGIDAAKVFRPVAGAPERKAPGPLLGVVQGTDTVEGEAKIDDQWRVPVAIAGARDYSSQGLEKFVWLPVQQQWAHGTHGAQFFPRAGTRVVIDFLYGNPDLPFIAGTMYTPSQPYPFDPTSKATQTGWRSVTDKNGSIVQEFRFEDKPGSEEIYLYTGRDYRRVIDQDDWGTVKRDQTLAVERDQKLTVTRDRTVTVEGKQETKITKTRTVTIIDKSLVESKKEIELKVGPSTITMTMQGIVIKAPKIEVKADVSLEMSGGAMAKLNAPKTDVTADAMLTLKGGIVLIN